MTNLILPLIDVSVGDIVDIESLVWWSVRHEDCLNSRQLGCTLLRCLQLERAAQLRRCPLLLLFRQNILPFHFWLADAYGCQYMQDPTFESAFLPWPNEIQLEEIDGSDMEEEEGIHADKGETEDAE